MRKWNDFFVIFFFSFGEDGFPKCFSSENEKNIIGAMTPQIAGGPLDNNKAIPQTVLPIFQPFRKIKSRLC